jgi:hypothetical protein
MKINKYISLDEDIFRELSKENNASEVINNTLKEYYNIKNSKSQAVIRTKLEDIKQILKENRRKERILSKELYKMQIKDKEFLANIQARYPPELVKQLKSIDNLDYDAAVALSRKFDLHRFGIGGIKLIKIWEELKGGR